MNLFPEPRTMRDLDAGCSKSEKPAVRLGDADIPAQGFRIRIEAGGITIQAQDTRGSFFAQQLLAQILERTEGDTLPGLLIEDWPDFEHRGYMLDISRDRVPTMEHLFHLVDYLAKLRYNQLQLYTEHTFAYSEHETVWKDASPMTAEEIQELDAYCRERHIELVANQNSFGHMERWLMHDDYKHLAECPDGFEHPLNGEWKPQGSVLKPDAESLEFVDGLYAELLPNFTSRKFNVGGDEPWELGFGASKDRVEREGKHAVYLDFLGQVCELAKSCGAEPMCWADILLEHSESIEKLPEGITPVLWGYEADHPFEEQCAILGELDRPFYVAPGDATWTSLTYRYENMFKSVRSAALHGHRRGASGLLMTHWGDNGHPQTWPLSLPGMVWAGLMSWNVSAEEPDLEAGLKYLLADRDGTFSRLLLEAGTIDDLLDTKLVNRSFIAYSMFIDDEELAEFEPKPDAEKLSLLLDRYEVFLEDLDSGGYQSASRNQAVGWVGRVIPNAPSDIDTRFDKDIEPYQDWVELTEELKLMINLSQWAARRCLGDTAGNDKAKRTELVERIRRCWLRRSRPGGLSDSLSKLKGLTAQSL